MHEYAGIHLLDAPYFIDNAFDYFIPPDLRGELGVGDFVTVPFGNANRRSLGVAVSLKDAPDNPDVSCKPVLAVCDRSMSLSDEMLGVCFFMKEQTLCTMGDAVRAVMPASALTRLETVYRPVASFSCENQTEKTDDLTLLICDFIRKKESVSFDLLKSKYGPAAEPALKKLLAMGAVCKDVEMKQTAEKTESFYRSALAPEELVRIADGESPVCRLRSPAHVRVIRYFAAAADELSEKQVISDCDVTRAQLKALCDKGLLTHREAPQRTMPVIVGSVSGAPIVLNSEQEEACASLCALADSPDAKAALLHGVTGSGKTNVMLKVIDHVLEGGRSVIVLLPEIALTPQSLAIFCSRYGERVAILHSGLSAGERFEAYRRIRRGHADVVIGTRSAVFAPLANPGLIVIDEEQEHTYKSDMNPKYHARDIARYRCAHHHALMLLASATPSFESYRKANEGIYSLIRLTHRYGNAILPTTVVADMRKEPGEGNPSPLGTLLCQRLVENTRAGNQSILFLNRRGYNNFISCRKCGEPVRCPVCSVSMSYHTVGHGYENGELRCHWCGRRMPTPTVCPTCQSPHLARMGYGTQRVEQELSSLLPDAKILRMDADTTTTKSAYEDILGSFRRHEAQVLLGTQMVTKGHDFPDVTLVGVLSADSSLYLDDYRAAERTFAMLTQVIGRAGRGDKPGVAIIQTVNPDNECIRLACAQDYDTFYQKEIRLRKLLSFPPFCDIATLTLTSPDEQELIKASGILAAKLNEKLRGEYRELPTVVFGPFEAPVYKVENRYRMRMVIKCRLNRKCRKMFSELLSEFSRSGAKGLTLSADFNPSNL